jgi:hypothetical protein
MIFRCQEYSAETAMVLENDNGAVIGSDFDMIVRTGNVGVPLVCGEAPRHTKMSDQPIWSDVPDKVLANSGNCIDARAHD